MPTRMVRHPTGVPLFTQGPATTTQSDAISKRSSRGKVGRAAVPALQRARAHPRARAMLRAQNKPRAFRSAEPPWYWRRPRPPSSTPSSRRSARSSDKFGTSRSRGILARLSPRKVALSDVAQTLLTRPSGSSLSDREAEVLDLAGKGVTKREIGARLGRSEHTSHVTSRARGTTAPATRRLSGACQQSTGGDEPVKTVSEHLVVAS